MSKRYKLSELIAKVEQLVFDEDYSNAETYLVGLDEKAKALENEVEKLDWREGKPTKNGWYAVETMEGRYGIALWENKWWNVADNNLKFGIKEYFIKQWKLLNTEK